MTGLDTSSDRGREPEDQETEETEETEESGARRSRGKRLVVLSSIVVVGLVVAAIFAALSYEPDPSNPLVDTTHRPARGFTLPSLLEPAHDVSLSDFRGKGLVLNFWGSWCGPCRTEMPLLESAYRLDHASVNFVGIDCDDTRGAAIGFLTREHVTYEALFDPQETVASAYGLYGLPTTVFISKGGEMLGLHIGQLDAKTLKAALTEAFGQEAFGRAE